MTNIIRIQNSNLLSTKLNRYIDHSERFLSNEKRFPNVSILFKNFNYWKIIIFILEAYKENQPISKNQLIRKLNCSYKTGNKYIDELVKKKIIISFNKNRLNRQSDFNLRNIDYINNIDKRFCYYIPSMNILKDFNDFLNLDFKLYKKKN
tara:strand:- start:164 stop:613 length:450 start_codon:yes stop_codon:yes gene_type:complete